MIKNIPMYEFKGRYKILSLDFIIFIFIISVTNANTKKAAVKLLLNGGGGEI